MPNSRSMRGLTLLLSLLLSSISFAQESTDDEAPSLPDLESLQSDWWSYFDGSRIDVEPRIEAFIATTGEQVANLAPSNQEAAQSALDATRDNFSAYLNLLDNTDVAMPAQPPREISYSLDDLLALAVVARDAEMGATEEQLEVERERRVFDSASSRRDLAFRNYVATAEGDDRWVAGLRLVQMRLALAMSARRLSLLTERSDSAAKYADDTAERVERARDLLAPTTLENEQSELQAKVDEDAAAVDVARRELRAAQVAASVLALDTAQGRSQQRLQQQTSLGSEIGLALAEVQLAGSRAKLWWNALKGNATTDLTQLESYAMEWVDLVRNVERRTPGWKDETEDELLSIQSLNRDNLDRDAAALLDERLSTAQQTLARIAALDDAIADLDLLTDVVDATVADYSGVLKAWFTTISRTAKSAYSRVISVAEVTLFSVGETPVTGGDILRVLIILIFAMLLSRGIRAAIQRVSLGDFSGTQASLYTVGRLTHYAIIILALFIALTSIGLDFSNLALVAGALSVGIGFGLQSIVNNFVSGLIILFEHSLRVGDFIELDTGLTGTVKAINVRSTLINTNDNIDIVVPNSEFVTTRLTNWTLGERTLRVRIPFGVAYGSDKELVRQAALEAAEEVPYTLSKMKNRNTDVWLVEFGDNSLNFLLLAWVNWQGAKRPTRTRAAYLWALETKLAEYGIEIPFPQRDLHLRSGWASPLGEGRNKVEAPAELEAVTDSTANG